MSSSSSNSRSGWRLPRRSRPASLFGAINGYLVGYLRLRAFLTTLVTFIIGRALFDILVITYRRRRAALDGHLGCAGTSSATARFWGLSVAVWLAIVLAIVAHIALTRSRPGWHMLAVGGSRRSAHNAGIRVRRTVFMTYVFSGFCAALGGFLIACRLSGAGPGTGLNLEILALTAAVVGGNSLGGGRGSIVKGLMGAIIVLVMTNGLIRLGYGTGTNQMVLGIMLAVGRDHRHPLAEEPPQGAERGLCRAGLSSGWARRSRPLPGSGTPYALDNRLSAAEHIGLGELEGPEDVILDRDDHLYCGTRHGEIVRFFAPDYVQLGSVRPYRRLSARPRLRPGRQSDQLRRRHGALFRLAGAAR